MKILRPLALALLASSLALADGPIRRDATLPNLGVTKRQVRQYYRGGDYRQDLKTVLDAARTYLEINLPRFSGSRPAIILDIDETAISNLEHFESHDLGFLPQDFGAWIELGTSPAIPEVLDLYRWCRARSLPVFFLSGRFERQRGFTAENLKRAGYLDWQELILRPDGSQMSASQFKQEQRRLLVGQGYSIMANLGDQESDLVGGYADATFKLPNPIYWIP